MLEELVKLANQLDANGNHDAAKKLDDILFKHSNWLKSTIFGEDPARDQEELFSEDNLNKFGKIISAFFKALDDLRALAEYTEREGMATFMAQTYHLYEITKEFNEFLKLYSEDAVIPVPNMRNREKYKKRIISDIFMPAMRPLKKQLREMDNKQIDDKYDFNEKEFLNTLKEQDEILSARLLPILSDIYNALKNKGYITDGLAKS